MFHRLSYVLLRERRSAGISQIEVVPTEERAR